MKGRVVVLVTLAAAVTLTSVGAGRPRRGEAAGGDHVEGGGGVVRSSNALGSRDPAGRPLC